MEIGGLDLVENTGDETLATKTYRFALPKGCMIIYWRGIESAPLDGTYVMGWAPRWRRPAIMKYNAMYKKWQFITGARAVPVLWSEVPVPPKGAES